MNDKRKYECAVISGMCQLKALAITKELGISGFKATLRLCQEAAGEREPTASSRDPHSMAMANHA